VNKYFFDRKSLNYIGNPEERQRVWENAVKRVGGNVIEEFIINCEMGSRLEFE
jgi:hypothetical protein